MKLKKLFIVGLVATTLTNVGAIQQASASMDNSFYFSTEIKSYKKLHTELLDNRKNAPLLISSHHWYSGVNTRRIR